LYTVPSGHTVAYVQLLTGGLDGQIQVRLDDPITGLIEPAGRFFNTTGMDIIDCGSNSSFTFVDQVAAALKPTTDGTHDGIKVQGGSNGTLLIEAVATDTVIRVTNSTTITTSDGSATGASRIGAGVTKMKIVANDAGHTEVNATANYLASANALTIETGSGTDNTINIGGGENSSVTGVVVHIGAGDNVVNVQQDGDADGATTATVDFDSGSTLGAGNALTIGTHVVDPVLDTSGRNCSVTLANAPDTSAHPIVVDSVQMFGGTLTVADATTVGDIEVLPGVDDLGEVAAIANVQAPLTFASSSSTTGTFTVGGTTGQTEVATVEFTGDSVPSTVEKFAISFSSLEDATGVVSVDSEADVTIRTSSEIGVLSIPGTGMVTLQERAGSPSSSTARVLAIHILDMGTPSSPDGVLDLTDNVMVVDYSSGSSQYGDIKSLLISGYSGHTWTGNGVNSSKAAASLLNSDPDTSVGYAEATSLFASFPATYADREVDNTTVLVKYTYEGDANIDGMVDITDLGIVATNWQTSDKGWHDGNFDYNYPSSGPNVDITDLGLLATNWQQGVCGPLFVGGDSEGEFLEGIDKLGLSEDEVSKLLEMLGEGGGEAL
jgi:hypothetical protein